MAPKPARRPERREVSRTRQPERRGPTNAPEPRHNECDDRLRSAAFHTGQDGVFQNSWGDVLCFPYTLCLKFWECGAALCAGTNYCMVYWLVLQWIMCKVSQITTPQPIVYPYFFNVFFQVFALSIAFLIIWLKYADSVFIPYYRAYVDAFMEVHYGPKVVKKEAKRVSYRKYCFRKSEVFEVPVDTESAGTNLLANYSIACIMTTVNYLISKVVH